MLANGKVMFWGRQHDLGPQIYDPVTGEVTNVPIADDHHGTGEHFNVFCSGHTLLPDGRLFVAGGHEENFIGTKTAFIYDPSRNHWIRLPDMSDRRWYPTVMALPDGDVLVLHGTIDSSTHFNEQPEIWQAATNTWRKINISQDLAENSKAHRSDFYPRTFVMPDGRVFYFGAAGATWILDPRPGVTNPWTPGPKLASKAVPNDYGTVTQYAPGKLLVAGGGIPGKVDAEVIDLNQINPQFRPVGFMAYPRRRHNATILPDGRVLMTGGESETRDGVAIQKVSEIWDPTTEKFALQTAVDVERVYHSTALLMPDGNVWTGGTGEPTTNDNVREQRNAQLFQPSYLFYNNRPEITLAPSNAALGQSIYVHVKRSQEITSANLIRLGSVTHSLEQSANFVPLSFSQSAGGLSINIPASANTVVPGYYFLTVVDYRGIPSESKIIQVLAAGQIALITIDNATVTESANNPTANFTVRLSKTLPTPTTILYRTLAASAKPALDYAATEQTLTIPAGQTTGTIRIPILKDAEKEPLEWFAVDLVSATGGAKLSGRRAQAIIRDSALEAAPTISIADGQATEGNDVVIQVSLSARSAFPVTVPYVTVVGSAGKGDYVSKAGSITIPVGSTTGQVSIRTLRDGLVEGEQSFEMRIPNMPGLSLADWEAQAKIVDATPPTLKPENLSVTEGTSKNTIAYVVVRLSSALDVAASVNFTTKSLSARVGSDFVATAGTLVFLPGETAKTFPIHIVGDSSEEGTEEFEVVFSSPSRSKLGGNQIKVKLMDDD
jgi:Domain of unknown function (DUF1929)/Calx-beta domain/Glyoxal oxidase N-terminus